MGIRGNSRILIEASVAPRYAEHVISGRIFPGRFSGEFATLASAPQITIRRIQLLVSGEEMPARIEVRSKQTEASHLRKLARFKVEGVPHIVSEKGSLTIGGPIEGFKNKRSMWDNQAPRQYFGLNLQPGGDGFILDFSCGFPIPPRSLITDGVL